MAAAQPCAGDDVVAHGHGGERVGPLEHHADRAAQLHRIDVGVVHVLAVQQHLPVHVAARDELVEPVDGAQHRRLPAPGGSDESGHRANRHRHRHAFHREEAAVVDVEVLQVDPLRHGCTSVRVGAACHACAARCSESASSPEVHTVTASGHGSAAADIARPMAAVASEAVGPRRARRAAARSVGVRHSRRTRSLCVRRGQFVGGPPVPRVRPRRVEHHRLAADQQLPGSVQQLRVHRVGAFGGVEALAVGRGGGLGGGEAGEFLAQPVAGEQHGAEPVGQRPAEGGLAGAGKAADQREPHGSGLEMPQAEVGVLRRVRRCGGVALLVAQAGDFGSDEGAVGHVVVAQGDRSGVPGELDVVVQPVVGEVGSAEPFEVHGEERHVVEAVEVAELVVELQAVQGARAVVEAEDVVGDEVAVAVDDPPVGAPVGEQRTAAGQEPGGQPVHRVDRLRRRHACTAPVPARCSPPNGRRARRGSLPR